jgi:hypothetical protein
MFGMIKPDLSKRNSVHIPIRFPLKNSSEQCDSIPISNSMRDLESPSFITNSNTPKKLGIGKRSNMAMTSESNSFASKQLNLKICLNVFRDILFINFKNNIKNALSLQSDLNSIASDQISKLRLKKIRKKKLRKLKMMKNLNSIKSAKRHLNFTQFDPIKKIKKLAKNDQFENIIKGLENLETKNRNIFQSFETSLAPDFNQIFKFKNIKSKFSNEKNNFESFFPNAPSGMIFFLIHFNFQKIPVGTSLQYMI